MCIWCASDIDSSIAVGRGIARHRHVIPDGCVGARSGLLLLLRGTVSDTIRDCTMVFGLRNALKCFAVLSILKPVSADMISKSADYDSCRKTLVASAPDSLVKADSPDGCDACS